MPPRKRSAIRNKIKDITDVLTRAGTSRRAPSPTPSPPPSPPLQRPGRSRRKNASRRAPSPTPNPPPVEDDDEDAEEHRGGEDSSEGDGGEGVEGDSGEGEEGDGGEGEEGDGGEGEDGDDEEDGFVQGLPFEPDPSLVWVAPTKEQEGYIARKETLQPREVKPYQRGQTKLPKLRSWPWKNVILVPAGKWYMVILAFRYRNCIIIEFFITCILILVFHCAVDSRMPTRGISRDVATQTSLEA